MRLDFDKINPCADEECSEEDLSRNEILKRTLAREQEPSKSRQDIKNYEIRITSQFFGGVK